MNNNLNNLINKSFGKGRCEFRITGTNLKNDVLWLNTAEEGTAYKHVSGTFGYAYKEDRIICKIIGKSNEMGNCEEEFISLINTCIEKGE